MQKVLMLITLLLASNMFAGHSLTTSSHAYSQNLVSAHRGSSSTAPENTLSSIRQAIIDGAGYAEIDVQETADGVVVLMHDGNAIRTTGLNKNLWEVGSHELKQASAGNWFSPYFQAEKVPTLEEIIDTAKNRIKLNIELKNNGHQKRLAEQTVEILKRKQFETDCIITSFDSGMLKKVKQLDPRMKTGLILGNKPPALPELLKSKDYEILSVAYPAIDKDFMQQAQANGKEVFAWTVNDTNAMLSMLSLGVSSVITNHPDRLIALLRDK